MSVRVRKLSLGAGDRLLLDGVDLDLAAGESVGLTGPSGCGKTTLALALFGHLRPGVRHLGGRCLVDGQDMLPQPAPGVRGRVLGYLGQDPGGALNPYARVGRIADAEALARVGLPAELTGRYPHQLSGGQQQRVALASVLARRPSLLVLDEPTTALDVLATREIVEELRRVRESGTGLLWISHDLDTVAALTDRVVELDGGRIVRQGPPRAAVLSPVHQATAAPGREVLTVRGLNARHGNRTVLTDVDLTVHSGQSVAVLGVSGAGKSTLARRITGLHPRGGGEIRLHGGPLAADVRRRTKAQRAALGLVAQSPADALHPHQSVRTALARQLRLLRGITKPDHEITRLLDLVRLPADHAERLPGELSGGQRQRVAVARALAGAPEVLICDEATAALDRETRDELLSVLRGLGLGLVLITHEPVVAAAADHVLVLAAGGVLAAGPAAQLLTGTDPTTAIANLLADLRGAAQA